MESKNKILPGSLWFTTEVDGDYYIDKVIEVADDYVDYEYVYVYDFFERLQDTTLTETFFTNRVKANKFFKRLFEGE